MPKNVELYALKSDILNRHLEQPSIATTFGRIRKETRRSPLGVVMEWLPYYRRPRRLRFDEYVYFGLHDSDRYTKEEKARFVSEFENNQLWLRANDVSWVAAAEDKWLMCSILEHHGLPTPKTLAIIGRRNRDFGSLRTIHSSSDLCDVFAANGDAPLFLKPVKGVASTGVRLLLHVSAEDVTTHDGSQMPTDLLFSEVVEGDDYLVQEVMTNHDVIAKLSSHLATVRCFNFVLDGEVQVASCLMKLCAPDNIADNFWRKGNMLAGIDTHSGAITHVIRGSGFDREELDRNPWSGAVFSGVELPHWHELRQLNKKCALMYPGLLFSSTDIAITNDGPVVIEVNNGGAVNLPQLLYQRGFMTDEAQRFFAEAERRT